MAIDGKQSFQLGTLALGLSALYFCRHRSKTAKVSIAAGTVFGAAAIQLVPPPAKSDPAPADATWRWQYQDHLEDLSPPAKSDPTPADADSQREQSTGVDPTELAPVELWWLVAPYLSGKDAGSFGSVCRLFRDIVQKNPILMAGIQSKVQGWRTNISMDCIGSVPEGVVFASEGVSTTQLLLWTPGQKRFSSSQPKRDGRPVSEVTDRFRDGVIFPMDRRLVYQYGEEPVILEGGGWDFSWRVWNKFFPIKWGTDSLVCSAHMRTVLLMNADRSQVKGRMEWQKANRIFSILPVHGEAMFFLALYPMNIGVYQKTDDGLRPWCSLNLFEAKPIACAWYAKSNQGLAVAANHVVHIWDTSKLKKNGLHDPPRSIRVSHMCPGAISPVTLPNGAPLLIAGWGGRNCCLSIISPIIGKEIAAFPIKKAPERIFSFVLPDRLVALALFWSEEPLPIKGVVLTVGLKPLLDATTPASAEPDSPPSQSPSKASDPDAERAQDGQG